jgi:four helix bundle protein
MAQFAREHRDLQVYQKAFEAAVEIFEITGTFPTEERFALTDQLRRSSRSVCANLAEAWRKRRYKKAFISKLSDAESEAAETQVWLEFAIRFGYVNEGNTRILRQTYDEILRTIVGMINNADSWLLPGHE